MAGAQKAQSAEQVAKLARIARMSRQECYTLRRALDSTVPTAETKEYREAVSERLRELAAVQAKALLKEFGL